MRMKGQNVLREAGFELTGREALSARERVHPIIPGMLSMRARGCSSISFSIHGPATASVAAMAEQLRDERQRHLVDLCRGLETPTSRPTVSAASSSGAATAA